MTKKNGKELETRIANAERPTTLQKWIESNQDVIQQALPKGYDIQRMIRIVMGTLRNNTNLRRCTPISFISGVMQSIQLGLEPNTALGHAYLIPYWNSKLQCYEAQFQRGYRGLLDMAYRTREFTEIYAQEVYRGDHFEYALGTEKYIRHVPTEKQKLDINGNPTVTHVYAVYKTVKGGMHFVVWTKEKLDRHKNRYSPAAKQDKFSAWNVNETAMYKKTVLKDLLNYADISIEFREQLQVDEIVKREIKPDMITTVKPIYEFSPDDIGGIQEVKLKEKAKKEVKEIKKIKESELKGRIEKEKSKKKLKEMTKKVDRPTDSDLRIMFIKARGAGYSRDKFEEYLKNKYKIKTRMQLSKKQHDDVIKHLNKKIEENIKKYEKKEQEGANKG